MKDIHIITEDLYGNEVNRETVFEDFYQTVQYRYNEKEDLIAQRILNQNGETETEFVYQYEYDQNGNKIKQHQTHYYEGKVDSESELYYVNEYDDNKNLVSITYLDHEKNKYYQDVFYYIDNLRMKREEYKPPFEEVYKTTFYKYNDKQELLEEEVNIKPGVVSYYITYQLLENQRYHKQLLSPVRGEKKWVLAEIEKIAENDLCTVIVKEPSLTADLIKEISEHIRESISGIKFITIDICQSEDFTYLKEIEEIEQYYKEKYGIIIIRDM